jgi:hypothetical protein
VPAPIPALEVPEGNVATPEESRTAQRIYDYHKKAKALRNLKLETAAMRARAQEYAKFLMAYVDNYAPPKGRLREDVKNNLLRVIRETPGMLPEIGFLPAGVMSLIIMGIKWIAGTALGIGILNTINKWLGVDEKDADLRLELARQGKTPEEIEKILNAGGNGSAGSTLASAVDLGKLALTGALFYFGWQAFSKVRSRRSRA